MSFYLRVCPVVGRAVFIDGRAAPVDGRDVPIAGRPVPVGVAFHVAGRAGHKHVKAVPLADEAVAVDGSVIFIIY
jgi:hypothetical protein